MMRKLTYAEAIREALREEMLRDENVILLGEDIGVLGGVLKVTKGLLEEFGSKRVRDTPISESAIVGAAIGSAIMGMRPVAEIMFMDFLNVCGDQLINHAGKIHFMSGGKLKVPMVIRTQSSLGKSAAAQHSQFFPAFFMNIPGMHVAVPSIPYDAKGLLKTAIRSDNPVLFIECAVLYRSEGPVPEEEYLIPFGKASIMKEGVDVTIFAISQMVDKALVAAKDLEKEGIDAEVIDPRTLVPFDKQTLAASIKKTGRLVTVEASCRTCGVGAEMAAIAVEEAFDYLDAPIARVAAPDTPAPFAPVLQDVYIPNEKDIIRAVKSIA